MLRHDSSQGFVCLGLWWWQNSKVESLDKCLVWVQIVCPLSVPLIVGHQNWNIWAAHPLQTTSTGRKFWSHRSHGPLTETAYCIWHMIHVYSCDVHKTQIMIDLAVFKPYLKWNYKWNAVRLQKSCWSEYFLCICAFSDFWTIFEKPR